MCYKLCLSIINKKTYGSKEEMKEKLSVFLSNNRITEEQHDELLALLESK